MGPNGSGKSNVIDAIMFVLGYRAKKMRQTKLSDLIHVSDGLSDLDSCSVHVHFYRILDDDGAEGSAWQVARDCAGTVDGQIVVSRVAYRSNRSVYLLNGTSSQYQEIHALLKAQGIDLDHRRFLILQGEVEAIAMMKPKGATEHEEGLLEYLEDIIGTNQYIASIEAAAKELDLANEVHAEKFLRVKAAERECQALRGEKEEAESYLRQENTRTERQNELLQASIWKARNEARILRGRIDEGRAELERQRTGNASDVAAAEELESTLKLATHSVTELERQSKVLQLELSALEQGDLRMQETRKHLKNRLRTLARQSADSAKQETDLQRSIADTNAALERLGKDARERGEELEAARGELERISSSLRNVTGKYQEALDAKQVTLTPLKGQARVLQQEMDLVMSAMQILQEKADEGQRERKKLEARLEEIEGQLAECKAKRAKLTSQVAAITAQIRAGRDRLAHLEEERLAAGKTAQILQSTAAEAMEAMRQAENGGGSTVHKALAREAKAGRIQGIHVGRAPSVHHS